MLRMNPKESSILPLPEAPEREFTAIFTGKGSHRNYFFNPLIKQRDADIIWILSQGLQIQNAVQPTGAAHHHQLHRIHPALLLGWELHQTEALQ